MITSFRLTAIVFLISVLLTAMGAQASLAEADQLTPKNISEQLLPGVERNRRAIVQQLTQVEMLQFKLQADPAVPPQIKSETLKLLAVAEKHITRAKQHIDFALDNIDKYLQTEEPRFIRLSETDIRDAGILFQKGMQTGQQAMLKLRGMR